ncbi:MAG: hypothetical protein LBS46_09340 [Dysgonamonadaceae bacterium]|jgi:hypothetical protein|nr:hypothetical protein [Dysgonamonadaceae bacterium]
MKKILVVLVLLAGLWVGCSVDSSQTIHYSVNEPVFTSPETFRRSIRITSEAHALGDCGKIGFYNHYLYISEPGKGIHIIDNTHPAQPQNKGYIEIPGHQDLIIRNHYLYVDALVDLVWFDLSHPAQPVLQGRAENLFPAALPVIDNSYGYDYELYQKGIAQGQIVTGWQLKERKEQNAYKNYQEDGFASTTLSQGNALNAMTQSSTSHFALSDDYLYAAINQYIHIIDLSGEKPEKVADNVYVGHVETILPYHAQLFLGTSSGLVIYSIEEPQRPAYFSQIPHVYGCNPIAIDNDMAYISVRSGNLCGQTTNELIIIDVSHAKQPQTLVSYKMQHPKGLGIDKGLLFVCDEGLKIFQTGKPETLMANSLGHFKEIIGNRVIPFNNMLLLISDKGLYQYDYSDGNIRLISIIPIQKQ